MPDASRVESVIQGMTLDGNPCWRYCLGGYFMRLRACARRLLCRSPALRCMTPFATTRSMRRCESRSTLDAASLLPAASALFTFLMAVRTVVRSLMLWMRRCTAWWARLRADLMFAMKGWVRKGAEFYIKLLPAPATGSRPNLL